MEWGGAPESLGQTWLLETVLEDPSRQTTVPDYIAQPIGPKYVWRSMAEWLRVVLRNGMTLRAAVDQLRQEWPEYRVAVPQPRVLRIEFMGQWPFRQLAVEAEFVAKDGGDPKVGEKDNGHSK